MSEFDLTTRAGLDQWIKDHGLTVLREGEWAAGDYRWIIECPWNQAHTDNAAYIVRFRNGAVNAGCHHNGCEGKGWGDLRAEVETGTPIDPIVTQSVNGQSPESPVVRSGSTVPPWRYFPTDRLPQAVAEYVKAHAVSKSCDDALIAPHTLSTLGAAIGNSHHVQLKTDWRESAALWTLTIGDSGEMKSPAMEAAVAPVIRRERRFSDPSVVNPTRYRISDATLESAILVLSDAPRGVILIRDELSAWFGGFNQYKGGSTDLQAWIELYEGRPVTVDRKTSGPSVVRVGYPFVGVAGTIQRLTLDRRIDAVHIESGFLARFLLVEPPKHQRRWQDESVTSEIDEAYHTLVDRLYSLKMNVEGQRLPNVIALGTDAKELWREYYDQHAEILERIASGPYRYFYSKALSVVAKLALIFHLCDYVEAGAKKRPSDVSGDAMRRAIEVAKWFAHETRRVYLLHRIDNSRLLSDDESRVNMLPDPCTWKDVGHVWGVERSQAFEHLKRLVKKQLIRKSGDGRYIPQYTTGLPDFPDSRGAPRRKSQSKP